MSQPPTEPEQERSWWRLVSVVVGLALFAGILAAPEIPAPVAGGEPLTGLPKRALAAAALVAFWWVTAPVPLAVTSLLPIALLPLLGVLPAENVSREYTNSSVHLFLGGMLLALAVQRSGLHRRFALRLLAAVGTAPGRLVFATMLASALLSMWISNVATTLMMLPIVLAVLETLEDTPGGRRDGLAVALLLGLAYGANIGGMATPIGTPPNMLFAGFYRQTYPDQPAISFGRWMMAVLPLVAVALPLLAWGLTPKESGADDRKRIRQSLRRQTGTLGPFRGAERWMLAIFATTALLWIFRRPIPLGAATIPGWSGGLESLLHRLGWVEFRADMVHDGTVAILGGTLPFFLRSTGRDGRSTPLMTWADTRTLPWGVLLLFGGGFAVAAAFQDSGLSAWVGAQMGVMRGWPPWAVVAGVCLGVTFLTELTSNTATTAVLLPILAETANGLGVPPLTLILPATLSASCAFMLPVATPPNTIVFGSGRVPAGTMFRTGLVINLVGVVLVTAFSVLYMLPLLQGG